VTEVK